MAYFASIYKKMLFFGLFPLFATFAELSIADKVGQLLIVQFHGEVANEEARLLIQEIKVGGFIYYNWANGLTSPSQVKELSNSLQKLAGPIPLFIGIDQEGGKVIRLKEGFTQFPSNEEIGKSGNPVLAEEAAFTMGTEMREVGINLNFAPVIDINSNPKNPVIGSRAFGTNPDQVIAFAKKALEGYQRSKILSTLKHYPGHGDVEVDSHKDLPFLEKSLADLEKCELLPFRALAPFADLIMTAHMQVPSLDPDYCVTLSKKALSYLRNSLGFQGLIITDSLIMKGVLKNCPSIEEAALLAFNAGNDLLLLGGRELLSQEESVELKVEDIRRIHSFLVKAVESGRIKESRLSEAVNRILQMKAKIIF